MTAAIAPGAIGAVLLFLAAAAASDRQERASDDLCGLTVAVPAGFEARRDGDRTVLRPIGGEGLRNVSEIGLTFARSAPSASLETVRPLGPTVARYRLSPESGGSGGPESLLVAERSVAGGVIRLEASIQGDEGGPPDFGPAWHALATVRCTVPAVP
ncbi:Tsi3 family protein [Methylobacterium sp. Leaf118]|uniref:Tsi3 family protein n=1 Tax=Methylobacterium sp. Leaf118 TaxID=2876562 RepID=UPI001E3C4FCE|nr:Tsi3 family protein [Methylobacterium sp. Leaf118]